MYGGFLLCPLYPLLVKRQQQSLKVASLRSKIDHIDDKLPSDPLPYVNQARDKGFSSWPTSLPLREQGLFLNKQEFRDSLKMRYNLPLEDLPSSCTRGSAFSVSRSSKTRRCPRPTDYSIRRKSATTLTNRASYDST